MREREREPEREPERERERERERESQRESQRERESVADCWRETRVTSGRRIGRIGDALAEGEVLHHLSRSRFADTDAVGLAGESGGVTCSNRPAFLSSRVGSGSSPATSGTSSSNAATRNAGLGMDLS